MLQLCYEYIDYQLQSAAARGLTPSKSRQQKRRKRPVKKPKQKFTMNVDDAASQTATSLLNDDNRDFNWQQETQSMDLFDDNGDDGVDDVDLGETFGLAADVKSSRTKPVIASTAITQSNDEEWEKQEPAVRIRHWLVCSRTP